MKARPAATTVDTVADALRAGLHAGRWRPGAALRQEELAAEFGVSRIPVREALSRLQAEGLLVVEPNRGAFVPILAAADVQEIFDLRVLLEGDAMRRAVAGHTPRSLRQLEAVQRELDEEDDVARWLEADAAFHAALYAPSGRRRTLEMIAALRAAVARFYRTHLAPSSRRAGWNEEHHALIAAVRDGDGDRATAVLTRHLRATEAAALAALEEAR
jgi:DNA-binding GntR family transcriptional regulator